jgi:hypothetical protein
MRLLLLAMLIAGGGCATGGTHAVVCTMEAKACPDGSYVGRDPEKNCEFRSCAK